MTLLPSATGSLLNCQRTRRPSASFVFFRRLISHRPPVVRITAGFRNPRCFAPRADHCIFARVCDMVHSMKKHFLIPALFLCAAAALLTVSCSKLMGYSVVLWTDPEKNLSDGDIVPVYIKSNISQTYVISAGGSDDGAKIEVPLWQLTEPAPRRQVEQDAERYAEYRHQYARVATDGLPVRADADSVARQVYRLRQDEVIKVLYKGEGTRVMSGQNELPGEWLRVLTSDGTEGWCYSYNLRLFDITDAEQAQAAAETADSEPAADERLNAVLAAQWYPESYAAMIQDRRIDLDKMKPEYGFDPGAASGQIKLTLNGLTLRYPYAGVRKGSGNQYYFTDTPLSITIRSESYIVVHYVDEMGRPTAYDFITLSQSVPELIRGEQNRRAVLYKRLADSGPVYTSSNYGQIRFTGNSRFEWDGFDMLVPSVIPAGSAAQGSAAFTCFLAGGIEDDYDGVIELHFDGSEQPVYFLYRLQENGLSMETINANAIRDNIVRQRSASPVVMFFSK